MQTAKTIKHIVCIGHHSFVKNIFDTLQISYGSVFFVVVTDYQTNFKLNPAKLQKEILKI